MKDLKGKTAFITGGSTGIGFGMATVFARAGMNVAITDIRDEELAKAEAELRKVTDNVLALNVDSTNMDSLKKAAGELGNAFGALHVLCNNAGIPGGGKVLETPDERWRNTHEVNFWGPLNGIRVFLPGMLEHGEQAHIVNTASFSGIHGHGNQSGYGTSKFAVVGLSEFLRNDLAKTNVSVSVLCPHVVDTPIIRALKGRVPEDTAKLITDMSVPAETVGMQVMQAMLTNEFYIFCDGTNTRQMLEARCADMMAAMDRQFPK
ncbi:MAG: SDR family NAD(P)-dependent oxidoreductase [Proteobacteria bacterium]|nr:SDR family NAD(P)-dependent oxidoreductase [Pseudomonadota bacterium]